MWMPTTRPIVITDAEPLPALAQVDDAVELAFQMHRRAR